MGKLQNFGWADELQNSKIAELRNCGIADGHTFNADLARSGHSHRVVNVAINDAGDGVNAGVQRQDAVDAVQLDVVALARQRRVIQHPRKVHHVRISPHLAHQPLLPLRRLAHRHAALRFI